MVFTEEGTDDLNVYCPCGAELMVMYHACTIVPCPLCGMRLKVGACD